MKEKNISFTRRSSFPATPGTVAGEELRTERPHSRGGCGLPARRAWGLSTVASAVPCSRGRGGEEAGLPAPPPGRTVSACPVTAVQPEPPHRAAARLSQGPAGGNRHGGGRPRHPPGSAGGAAQVGGSLPSPSAPRREATSAAGTRKPAAVYKGAGGRSAGGQGRWEDRWDGLSPCPQTEV